MLVMLTKRLLGRRSRHIKFFCSIQKVVKCRHLCSGTVSSFMSGHLMESFPMDLLAETANLGASALRKLWLSGIVDSFQIVAGKEKCFLL